MSTDTIPEGLVAAADAAAPPRARRVRIITYPEMKPEEPEPPRAAPAPPPPPPDPIPRCPTCNGEGILVDQAGGLRKRRACECHIGRLHAKLNFRLRLRDSLKEHIAERRNGQPFSADLLDSALHQGIIAAGEELQRAEALVTK